MSPPRIHPTALVDAAARLHESVTVGPYTLIGAHVTIDAGCDIGAHCVIDGHTFIGAHNRIFSHVSLGAAPQDKKYAGEETQLHIGARNTIREFCTINTGTVQGGGATRVGSDNWIMAYVHIAHDCQVGDQTILANNATLAGHVHVGDWAILGGLSGVHQFSRIGAHAMIGFASHVSQDVPPFMLAEGNPLAARGLNIEGLRRRNFAAPRIAAIKHMHRLLYRENLTLASARARIAALARENPQAAHDAALMCAFLDNAQRGIVRRRAAAAI